MRSPPRRVRSRRPLPVAIALLVCAAAAPARAEMPATEPQVPPIPSTDAVDHEHPERYLQLPVTLGSRDGILRIAAAAGLVDKGGAPLPIEDKVKRLQQWAKTSLKADKPVYKWRNVEQIVAERTYNGNGELAEVFGALLRASGVPVVWLKALPVDWIHEYQRAPAAAPGTTSTAGNHTWKDNVFLEVYDGDRWALLELSPGFHLYRQYDHTAKVVPGPAWVYDKGGDPFALPLPSRWQLWREQARRYLATFDASKIPTGPEPHWWGEPPDAGSPR